ncbi:MAG: hypothetical protein EHM43_01400 [Ignavibacteriae bacterium]|nr:MAG: hypothetical protein EHM43_01400 [Ignavibacteriota bacterium]
MKTRSILMVLTLILVGGFAAHAQDLGAGSIKLILNGQSYGGTLTAQANAGPTEYTWTLPNASGTLALESAGSGWTTLGNTLGSTGLLGSLNTYDVDLIANNQTRMTLLNGTAAVLLPAQTEIRLGDAAGGQYTALKSPTVVTGGSSGGNITLVLPDGLPGGEDVRLQVKTVNTTTGVVELMYSNPNTTGSIGFKGLNTQTCNPSAAAWVDVADMTFQVDDNSIYSFEVIVEMDPAQSGGDVTWGIPGNNAEDAAVEILYRIFELTGNGNMPGGLTEDSIEPLDAGKTYILKGYIETANITPATPYTLQLRLRKTGPGATTCITAKSAVQLITE